MKKAKKMQVLEANEVNKKLTTNKPMNIITLIFVVKNQSMGSHYITHILHRIMIQIVRNNEKIKKSTIIH